MHCERAGHGKKEALWADTLCIPLSGHLPNLQKYGQNIDHLIIVKSDQKLKSSHKEYETDIDGSLMVCLQAHALLLSGHLTPYAGEVTPEGGSL